MTLERTNRIIITTTTLRGRLALEFLPSRLDVIVESTARRARGVLVWLAVPGVVYKLGRVVDLPGAGFELSCGGQGSSTTSL